MATKIGGQRVTVSLENGAPVLRIDGAIVTGDPPAIKGGSLTRALTSYGANYVIEWPDGTIVRAGAGSRGTRLNVRVRRPARRRGALEGLLGNDDGDVDNDDGGRGGARRANGACTQATSLFDYQPGQSSDDVRRSERFRIRARPCPTATPRSNACREEGITDPQLLHDCIIDFGITNGFLFANQYAHQQKVLEARAALAPMSAAALPSAKERVVIMAGDDHRQEPADAVHVRRAGRTTSSTCTSPTASIGRRHRRSTSCCSIPRQADRAAAIRRATSAASRCRWPARTPSKATWRRIRSASTACRSGSCGTIASRRSSTATSSPATSSSGRARRLHVHRERRRLDADLGQGLRAQRHVHDRSSMMRATTSSARIVARATRRRSRRTARTRCWSTRMTADLRSISSCSRACRAGSRRGSATSRPPSSAPVRADA